ncbi:unnamed protein product [Closterium sp. NIES-54]
MWRPDSRRRGAPLPVVAAPLFLSPRTPSPGASMSTSARLSRKLPLQPACRPCSPLGARLRPARRPCSPPAALLQPTCANLLAPPCCPTCAALLAPPYLRRPAAPAAAAARATAAAGGVSAGSATGAGGAGRATRSAGGAAGARGAGPTTARQCLSWPLSRQLQRLGVDSGSHCLSRTIPTLSSFASGFFSEPIQRCVTGSALGASEFAAALGASESVAALGATNPTGGPVVARASTVLLCTAVPSGSLSGFRLPTFSTNLVSNAAIQDVVVDTFIPGGHRVAICTCSRTGHQLATFTQRPGSSLYTLINASAQVAEAGQVAASSQVFASGELAASCSCRVLSHQTILWHHHLSHPSLPRLRGMHSCLLVSCLNWFLPSLPRSPAPPCLPCVKGRQRAAPHSSKFPPTTTPLQTLHMDVWGPAPVSGTDQERYFLLVVGNYTRYTNVFPLRRKADVSGVLIPWIRATHRQLRERFSRDFPVLRLHSDRGGEFSSDLLVEFCRDKGSRQSFTLPASPQQNGIAKHRIGLIMEVARTSMIHAAAPHFLWPFVVQYAAHELNVWPRVSEPETSPTLRWTGKVGDASVFRVWGALSLVRDAKASKLSSRTLRCVFLGFPTDTAPWQFYHPRLRRVFSSQEVTFDESVCYYRLHPHGSAPSGVSEVDPPPLVEPLEISSDSSGPAKGDDPAVDDTAATRRSPRLETPPAETAGAEPGGVETEGEGSAGAAPGGAGSGGAATGGASSWGAATGGADSGGPASPSGGGAVGDSAGGLGARQPLQPELLETLSPQAIRAWIVRRGSPGGGGYSPAGAGSASPGGTASAGGTGGTAGGAVCAGGATGAGGSRGTAGARGAGGAAGAGGAGGTAGAGGAGARGSGGTGGSGAAGPGGACTRGAGVARAGGAAGAGGAGDASGATSTGGAGGTTGARGPGAAGASGAAGAGGAGAGAAGTALRIPFFYPQPRSSLPPPDSVLRQVLSLPSSTGLPLPLLCPPTEESQPQLVSGSLLPARAPHTEMTKSLTERREPETRASTPVRAPRVARSCPPAVLGTHGMALRPSSFPQRVVLPKPPTSSLPHVPDLESDLARAASPTVTPFLATVVTDPDLESTAAFVLVTELVDFAARSHLDYVASLVTESETVCPPSVAGELTLGNPDALDIPTLRSYAEAIADEYSSQWQTAMDAEMASWKSTGAYVDEVPPPGANIVDGMWIFRVKRPPGSPPAFKARYVARGFSQREEVDFFHTFSPTPKMTTLWVLLRVATQRDYELHSLDFSTTFLQGTLHEAIWLRRSRGFTGSFPEGTQWSLRQPVYSLRQAPHEWHDTLRTTLAALGFAPSIADPSLFLRTDTSLPPF